MILKCFSCPMRVRMEDLSCEILHAPRTRLGPTADEARDEVNRDTKSYESREHHHDDREISSEYVGDGLGRRCHNKIYGLFHVESISPMPLHSIKYDQKDAIEKSTQKTHSHTPQHIRVTSNY